MYQETQEKMTAAPRRSGSTMTYVKIGAVIIIALVVITFVAKQFFIDPQMNTYETQMNTQFATCERALGSYYNDAGTTLGIAKANNAGLVKILNAVATRNPYYVGSGVPGLNNPASPVYVQLLQAYPDLKQSSDFYKNAEAIMIGDYANYSALGNQMSKLIAQFDATRNGPFNFLLGEYPNNVLRVQLGNAKPLTNMDAYNMMNKVVTDQNVTTSYNQGYTQPVVIPTP